MKKANNNAAFSLIQVTIAAGIMAAMGLMTIAVSKKFFLANKTEYLKTQIRNDLNIAMTKIQGDLYEASQLNGQTGLFYNAVKRIGGISTFNAADLYDGIEIIKGQNSSLSGRISLSSVAVNGISMQVNYIPPPVNTADPSVNAANQLLKDYFEAAINNQNYFILSTDKYRNLIIKQDGAPVTTGTCPAPDNALSCIRFQAAYPTIAGNTKPYFTTAETAPVGNQMVVAERLQYFVNPSDKSLYRNTLKLDGSIRRSEVILRNVNQMRVAYQFAPSALRKNLGIKETDLILRHPKDRPAEYWNTVNGTGDTAKAENAVSFGDVSKLTVLINVGLPGEIKQNQVSEAGGFEKDSTGTYGIVMTRTMVPGQTNIELKPAGKALDTNCSVLENSRCNPNCAHLFTDPNPNAPFYRGYAVYSNMVGANWWNAYDSSNPSGGTSGASDLCKCGKAVDDLGVPQSTPYADPNTQPEKLPFWSKANEWAQLSWSAGNSIYYNANNGGTANDTSEFNPNSTNIFTDNSPSSLQKRRLDYCARVTNCGVGRAAYGPKLDRNHPLCGLVRTCLTPSAQASVFSQSTGFNYTALYNLIMTQDGNKMGTDLGQLWCATQEIGPQTCDNWYDRFLNRSWDQNSPSATVSKPPAVSQSSQTNTWRTSCACELNYYDSTANTWYEMPRDVINYEAVCGVEGFHEAKGVEPGKVCSRARRASDGAWMMWDNSSSPPASSLDARQFLRRKPSVGLCACYKNSSDALTQANTYNEDADGSVIAAWTANAPIPTAPNNFNATDLAGIELPTTPGFATRRMTNQPILNADSFYNASVIGGYWSFYNWQYRGNGSIFDFRIDRSIAAGENSWSITQSNKASRFVLANEVPARMSDGSAVTGTLLDENGVVTSVGVPMPIPPNSTGSDPATTNTNPGILNTDRTCGWQPGIGDQTLDPKCMSAHGQWLSNVRYSTPSNGTNPALILSGTGVSTLGVGQNISCSRSVMEAGWYTYNFNNVNWCLEDSYPNGYYSSRGGASFYNQAVPNNWPAELAPKCLTTTGTADPNCSNGVLVLNSQDATPVNLWPYRFYCSDRCGLPQHWNAVSSRQLKWARYQIRKLYSQITGQSFDIANQYLGWCDDYRVGVSGGGSTGGT